MDNSLILLEEDLIKYWNSLFVDNKSNRDLEDILRNVSGWGYKKALLEYNRVEEEVSDAVIDLNYEGSILLNRVLKKIKETNYWVYVYKPILEKYFHKLELAVENSSIIHDTELFITQVLNELTTQLHRVAFQTIVAEVYYAKENDLLEGLNSSERGSYYSDILLSDKKYIKDFYSDYPELGRILRTKVENGINFIIKVIEETKKNINEIERAVNNGNKLGRIIGILMGEGDTHNKGQTVTQLIFENDIKIMYKPHGMELEKSYKKFTSWLNSVWKEGDLLTLNAPMVYTIGDSGWMEYIEYEECKTNEEVKNFYYRIGMILCILYTTNGIDIHYENIIAHRDMPILIDLETFIHPDLIGTMEITTALEKAVKEMTQSVGSIALLPTYVMNKNLDKPMDIGGIGAKYEQKSPFVAKFISNFGSDDVKIMKMQPTIETKNNNPSVEGETVDCKLYKDDIIKGFKMMYKWVCCNKQTYIDKLTSLFSGSEVRVIYRATNVYGQLLYSSYHPDLLTNSVDRKIYLHRLAGKEYEKHCDVIALELEELYHGDIPYFKSTTDTTSIQGVYSDVLSIEPTIERCAIDSVSNKINSMCESDLFRQISVIHSRLDERPYKVSLNLDLEKIDKARDIDKIKCDQYVNRIAEYILNRSIEQEQVDGVDRAWYGIEENEYGLNVFRPLLSNIYSGYAGMALFFLYAYQNIGKSKYMKICEKICDTMIEMFNMEVDNKGIKDIDIGAFTGLAGVCYTIVLIDHELRTNTYQDIIITVLSIIERKLNDDVVLDVTREGGVLGTMLSIHDKCENEQIKKKALLICNKVYKKLSELRVRFEGIEGFSWTKKGYTGYAHGNAGILPHLYRLFKITKDKQILKLINQALKFERELFDKKNGNWKKSISDDTYSCAWCHGATGILLSKIQLFELGYDDSLIRQEIEIALETVQKEGFNQDYCLCHGDIGNLSILIKAGQVLGKQDLKADSKILMQNCVMKLMDKINEEDFKEFEHNGFMLGLSGVGYEIMRNLGECLMPDIMGLT